MSYDRFRTADFTSVGGDYELLTNVNIKEKIKERLKIDDVEYAELLVEGFRKMTYEILISGTQLSVNQATYESPFDDTIFSSGGEFNEEVTSIRVKDTAITGQFMFKLG